MEFDTHHIKLTLHIRSYPVDLAVDAVCGAGLGGYCGLPYYCALQSASRTPAALASRFVSA